MPVTVLTWAGAIGHSALRINNTAFSSISTYPHTYIVGSQQTAQLDGTVYRLKDYLTVMFIKIIKTFVKIRVEERSLTWRRSLLKCQVEPETDLMVLVKIK